MRSTPSATEALESTGVYSPGRQLDFVAFLDGREQERDAVEADVDAFRRSWRRVKWDIAQH